MMKIKNSKIIKAFAKANSGAFSTYISQNTIRLMNRTGYAVLAETDDICNPENFSFALTDVIAKRLEMISSQASLEFDNKTLVVKEGRSRVKFTLEKVREFELENTLVENNDHLEFNLSELLNTVKVISANNENFNQNAAKYVYFKVHSENNKAQVYTCDGFKLSSMEISCAATHDENFSVETNGLVNIIPYFSLADSDKISFDFGEKNKLLLKAGNIKANINYVNSLLFNSSTVMATDNMNFFIARKEDVLKMVNDVLPFTLSDKGSNHLILLNVVDSCMSLENKTPTVEWQDEVEIKNEKKINAKIGINCLYLKKLVSVVDTEEITFGYKNSISPLYLKGKSFQGILCPMRLVSTERG